MREVPEDNVDELNRYNGKLSPSLPDVDQELQFEERHSKLIAENASLKRANSDSQRQLEDIEERYDRLQESSVGRFVHLLKGRS